jgi:hypothetical protein
MVLEMIYETKVKSQKPETNKRAGYAERTGWGNKILLNPPYERGAIVWGKTADKQRMVRGWKGGIRQYSMGGKGGVSAPLIFYAKIISIKF